MHKVKLTIATTDYDHFRDFRTGVVEAQGIDHTWLTLGHHEIFLRFTFGREWDVSELSFAKFVAQVTRDEPDIIALPVFASRLFRFGSFYVYMRGWLHNEAGVKLTDIHWYQAGANEAGRIEKVELDLPAGVKLTRVADKSLSDMLAAGEIDCALIARPPNCFLRGHPDVVRLFPDFLEREEEQYARTKVFPIMHVIAMKRSLLADNPWIARNLVSAFEESKRRSLERLYDPAVSRYPLPWLPTYARRMRDLFGGDPFPFGIEENRPTLATFLAYCHQQGIAHRLAKPEEIFPAGIMEPVRV
jgi:4,5-dihydroxyphthalate decarboxylase